MALWLPFYEQEHGALVEPIRQKLLQMSAASIDRVHARIERQGDCYFLADAGSEGGTFLNNRRLTQSTKLHAGDLIRLGGSVLMFGERAKASNSTNR